MGSNFQFSHFIVVNIRTYKAQHVSHSKKSSCENQDDILEMVACALNSKSLEIEDMFHEWGCLPLDHRNVRKNVVKNFEIASATSSVKNVLDSFSTWVKICVKNEDAYYQNNNHDTIVSEISHKNISGIQFLTNVGLQLPSTAHCEKSKWAYSDGDMGSTMHVQNLDCIYKPTEMNNDIEPAEDVSLLNESSSKKMPSDLHDLSAASEVGSTFWPKTKCKSFLLTVWGNWHFQEFLQKDSNCKLPQFCQEWCDVKIIYRQCVNVPPSEVTLPNVMATLGIPGELCGSSPAIAECLNLCKITARLVCVNAFFRVTNCLHPDVVGSDGSVLVSSVSSIQDRRLPQPGGVAADGASVSVAVTSSCTAASTSVVVPSSSVASASTLPSASKHSSVMTMVPLTDTFKLNSSIASTFPGVFNTSFVSSSPLVSNPTVVSASSVVSSSAADSISVVPTYTVVSTTTVTTTSTFAAISTVTTSSSTTPATALAQVTASSNCSSILVPISSRFPQEPAGIHAGHELVSAPDAKSLLESTGSNMNGLLTASIRAGAVCPKSSSTSAFHLSDQTGSNPISEQSTSVFPLSSTFQSSAPSITDGSRALIPVVSSPISPFGQICRPTSCNSVVPFGPFNSVGQAAFGGKSLGWSPMFNPYPMLKYLSPCIPYGSGPFSLNYPNPSSLAFFNTNSKSLAGPPPFLEKSLVSNIANTVSTSGGGTTKKMEENLNSHSSDPNNFFPLSVSNTVQSHSTTSDSFCENSAPSLTSCANESSPPSSDCASAAGGRSVTSVSSSEDNLLRTSECHEVSGHSTVGDAVVGAREEVIEPLNSSSVIESEITDHQKDLDAQSSSSDDNFSSATSNCSMADEPLTAVDLSETCVYNDASDIFPLTTDTTCCFPKSSNITNSPQGSVNSRPEIHEPNNVELSREAKASSLTDLQTSLVSCASSPDVTSETFDTCDISCKSTKSDSHSEANNVAPLTSFSDLDVEPKKPVASVTPATRSRSSYAPRNSTCPSASCGNLAIASQRPGLLGQFPTTSKARSDSLPNEAISLPNNSQTRSSVNGSATCHGVSGSTGMRSSTQSLQGSSEDTTEALDHSRTVSSCKNSKELNDLKASCENSKELNDLKGKLEKVTNELTAMRSQLQQCSAMQEQCQLFMREGLRQQQQLMQMQMAAAVHQQYSALPFGGAYRYMPFPNLYTMHGQANPQHFPPQISNSFYSRPFLPAQDPNIGTVHPPAGVVWPASTQWNQPQAPPTLGLAVQNPNETLTSGVKFGQVSAPAINSRVVPPAVKNHNETLGSGVGLPVEGVWASATNSRVVPLSEHSPSPSPVLSHTSDLSIESSDRASVSSFVIGTPVPRI